MGTGRVACGKASGDLLIVRLHRASSSEAHNQTPLEWAHASTEASPGQNHKHTDARAGVLRMHPQREHVRLVSRCADGETRGKQVPPRHLPSHGTPRAQQLERDIQSKGE